MAGAVSLDRVASHAVSQEVVAFIRSEGFRARLPRELDFSCPSLRVCCGHKRYGPLWARKRMLLAAARKRHQFVA
jgi:hypothetical protein